MKTLLSLTAVILSLTIYGQVPQAFKYQAVARDANGDLLVNQQISVRITIIDSASGGTSVYSEIHKEGTNQFGLFSINIGEGVTPTGVFANIPWATGNKWIKIELDPTGGTTYSNMGTHPLLSVPYALFAGNLSTDSDNQTLSISGDTLSITNGNSVTLPSGTIDTDDQNLSVNGTLLSIEDGNSVDLSVLQDGVNDADADSTNELQVLSISNDTIFLTNGGFVKLPSTSTNNVTTKSFVYGDTIAKGDAVILGNGQAGYLIDSTGNGNTSFNQNSNQFFVAQSFEAEAKGLKAIEIRADQTCCSSSMIYVSIRDNISGMPGSTDLVPAVSLNATSSISGRIVFAFTNPIPVVPGSSYFVVVRYVATSTSNTPLIHYNNNDIYPSGFLLTSNDSGSTWQSVTGDLQLKLYETITEEGLIYRSDATWGLSEVVSGSGVCIATNNCNITLYGGGDLWTNFLGFALENGLPGETHPVQVVGINPDHSGLQSWSNYYISSNIKGGITTTGGTQVGKAISPTEILIKNF